MKAKMVMAGLLVVGYVLPAAAQSTWYIVRDPTTKHCQIVDQRPVSHETTVLGPDGQIYKTRTEAETAMKTVKVCTE